MKILNVICTLDPSHGGPADGTIKLAEIWSTQGHEVEFATLDHPSAPYLEGIAYTVKALGDLGGASCNKRRLSFWKRFGYSPKAIPWLKSHAAKYDAIIVHSLWNFSTVAARWALVGGRVPYFVFPHGCLDPWFRKTYPKKDLAKRLLWKINEGPLLNNAATVFFTTQEEGQLAEKTFYPWSINPGVVGFGTSKIVNSTCEQRAAFKEFVPNLTDRPYILYLSRLHPKKGCDLLIDAFIKLAGENPSLDLVMAGPDEKGMASLLRAKVEQSGIAHRVHWTGMISGDAKWGAFFGCQAFILPSHSENFGIAVAEALACSKPVLITDKVNLWREVVYSHAGIVEADTQAGIEQLLLKFSNMSDDERIAMGASARACYESNFRMESTAKKVLDAIIPFSTQSG